MYNADNICRMIEFLIDHTLLHRGSRCQELSVRASSIADRASTRGSAEESKFHDIFVHFGGCLFR